MLHRSLVIPALLVFLLAAAPAALANQLIVIDKSVNKLYFYQDDQLTRLFPVATGKSPGLTPEGTFTVVSKMVNPYYGKLNIPGDSPQNPLGVRWLGLSIGGGGVYGIHGNNNPASIGTYASAGCIRMHNQDVIWLYDRVPLGARVRIVGGDSSPTKAPPAPAPPEPVFLAVNGEKLDLPPEQQPFLLEDRSFLPLRPVAEGLNYQLAWDEESNGIRLTGGGQVVSLQTGREQLAVNGLVMALDQPPRLLGSTTYVPASFFRDILKLQVYWDDEFRVISVSGAEPGQAGLPDPL